MAAGDVRQISYWYACLPSVEHIHEALRLLGIAQGRLGS
jgi:hypothetical protein